MRRGVFVLGAVVALLVVGAGLVAFMPPNTGSERTAAPDTRTPGQQLFTVTIDDIEQCGTTCRDVTTTLRNEQPTTARNITLWTRLFAGRGTDGDLVWQGSERVRRLEPGASTTATKRVTLSVGEGLTIRSNDGWVTLQTTVETANGTVRFSEQRQVA
jgi:hypothetical protein